MCCSEGVWITMRILWITFLTLAVVHSSQSEKEQGARKDGPQECTSETCGPNLRPTIYGQKSHQETDEAVRRERLYEYLYPHGRDKIQTNFHCHGKPYIPGFYADMEADCKIFHICLETTVEHYMCPGNTSFDQRSLICKPQGEVKCHLTPTYYVMNANIRPGHPIVPGTKEFALNKDSEKWLYDLVKGDREQFNASDKDALERSLIRMLLLMQFVDASDVLSGILAEEETHGDVREERALNTSQLTGGVLDHILKEIFQLLPVRFSSEPRTPKEKEGVATEFSEQGAPKEESLWGDFQKIPDGESASESRSGRKGRSLGISEHPSRKALKMMELILSSIGRTSGKLSILSRSLLTWNYIKYLNLLSAGLKP